MGGGLTLWNRGTGEKIRGPAGSGCVRVAISPTAPLQVAEIPTQEKQRVTVLQFSPGGKNILGVAGLGTGRATVLREWEIHHRRERGATRRRLA